VVEVIGWLSSLILLATVIAQLRKQWSERSTRGVSKWLFFGQAAASLGFTVYSTLVHNWVFVVTNALLLVSALTGCVLTLRFQKKERPSEPSTQPQ
jgi:MtN3 and saliva related transmembrane protein